MRQVHNQVLTLAYCSGRSGSRVEETVTSRDLVHKSQLLARNRIKEATARGSGAAARSSRAAAGFNGGGTAVARGGGGVLLGQALEFHFGPGPRCYSEDPEYLSLLVFGEGEGERKVVAVAGVESMFDRMDGECWGLKGTAVGATEKSDRSILIGT
ncbi:hypothetical protein F2Q68_00004368 [Brassica cretica]|uniref:Uncharacterized protein n=1 Tax=Brassica cretica TaxID=69181 RepID=A0A8S9JI32_BRACR|nr:hypothetical protein F2Q68_00004368 [Brassica cretica]